MAGLRRDIHKGDRISYADIDILFYTPKSLDGLGLESNFNKSVYKKIKPYVKHYDFTINDIPYLVDAKQKIAEIQDIDYDEYAAWLENRLQYRDVSKNIRQEEMFNLVNADSYFAISAMLKPPAIKISANFPMKFIVNNISSDKSPFSDMIVKKAVKQKNFDFIRTLCTGDMQVWFDYMRGHAKGRLFSTWLTTGLKIAAPYVDNIDISAMKMYYDNYESIFFETILKSQFGYNEYIEARMYCELYFKNMVEQKAIMNNLILSM